MFATRPRAAGFTIVWTEGVIFRSIMTYHVQFLLLVLAGWGNRVVSKNTNELKTHALGRFRIRGVYAWFASGSGTTARGGNSSDGPGSKISAKREATYCRDRMAPDSTIRHPVPTNRGTAETDEIFRAVGGVLQG